MLLSPENHVVTYFAESAKQERIFQVYKKSSTSYRWLYPYEWSAKL